MRRPLLIWRAVCGICAEAAAARVHASRKNGKAGQTIAWIHILEVFSLEELIISLLVLDILEVVSFSRYRV